MRLAFFRGTGSLFDRIILARTDSEFCHCELLFSDDTTFSSDISDGGVRFTDGSSLTKYPALWETVNIGPVDEIDLTAACVADIGLKYDLQGCLDYFLDRPDTCTNKWFCSSLCVSKLQPFGMFRFMTPTRVSPGDVYLAAKVREEMLLSVPAV